MLQGATSATSWSGGATTFQPTNSQSSWTTQPCGLPKSCVALICLKSTARQLLLIRALGYSTQAYFHCELVLDQSGARLAKRHDALSIRHLRESGMSPKQVIEMARLC